MGLEQFNNMLTLAVALSMAGWVARSPDYISENNQQIDNNEEIDFFGLQQQSWQNDDNEALLAPLMQTMPAYYDVNDNFQDSKFMRDFTSISEVQDLLSWEEAYRRGDLSFGGTNFAFPYTYEGNNEHLFTELQNCDDFGRSSPRYDVDSPNDLSRLPSYYDDGYGSGDTNVGSPASLSDVSLFSLNLDDVSATSSPTSPNLFDLNDTAGVEDLNAEVNNETLYPTSNGTDLDIPGAVGYSVTDPDFDIEKLFQDDYYDLHDALPRRKDEPPETVGSRVSDLEYASPLIDPNFDDYIGRVIGPDLHNNVLDTSLDDPFRMQFTENSSPDGKFIFDSLLDFEPLPSYGAPYEADFSAPENAPEDVERIESIQGASQGGYSGQATNNIHSTKSISHLNEHDYALPYEEAELLNDPNTRNAVDTLASNFYKYHKDNIKEEEIEEKYTPPSPPQPTQNTRTFAPPSVPPSHSRSQSTSSSSLGIRKNKDKSSIIYPDFPYTQEELIDMDVDHFNTLISKLDDIRQLVLRDMRKRGKNKHAARNCRKRKLDVIDNLDNNVELLEKQKELLLKEQQLLLEETRQIHEKTVWLNNFILERLYDENGNSYADSDYTLEYTTDGNVYVVPYVRKKQGKTA